MICATMVGDHLSGGQCQQVEHGAHEITEGKFWHA